MKLTINASKIYDIIIAEDFSAFPAACKNFYAGRKILIVTDDNVKSLYLSSFKNILQGEEVFVYALESGEKSKTPENLIKIVEFMAENGFTRKDTVITLGGGVVGDIGALAASVYMRGVTLIAVPTTLLSMVDSSVGGKTAVDLKQGKNLLGTFYQPDAVYIDTACVKTLPQREIICGMGEIIKYALLDCRISESDLENVSDELIYKCLSIKKEIVESDERESGKRMLLNLGHTAGHAAESLSGYELSHGESVLIGLKYAIDFSARYFSLTEAVVNEMLSLLNRAGKISDKKFVLTDIIKRISSDKKRDGNYINFVALKGRGKPVIVKIDIKTLGEMLNR